MDHASRFSVGDALFSAALNCWEPHAIACEQLSASFANCERPPLGRNSAVAPRISGSDFLSVCFLIGIYRLLTLARMQGVSGCE